MSSTRVCLISSWCVCVHVYPCVCVCACEKEKQRGTNHTQVRAEFATGSEPLRPPALCWRSSTQCSLCPQSAQSECGSGLNTKRKEPEVQWREFSVEDEKKKKKARETEQIKIVFTLPKEAFSQSQAGQLGVKIWKLALARSDYWLSRSSDYLTAKSPLCQQLIMKCFRCLFGALQAAYGDFFFPQLFAEIEV